MKIQEKSKYRRKMEKQDTSIYREWTELIGQGITKMNVYNYLMKKHKKNHYASIWNAVKRGKEILERQEKTELETN